MRLSYTELREILANDAQRQALMLQVAELLLSNAALKQQILDLLAGDAALQAKASAVFAKSEAVEAKMRSGLPNELNQPPKGN